MLAFCMLIYLYFCHPLFVHLQEKIHKWDQGKCSEFQNQIDLRKIEELKRLLYEVTSMNLNIHYAGILHVNLPLFLSSPIRPFTINKLFPLQKSKSFLPYPFFIGSELLLLREICILLKMRLEK
jgi:hypothetical protein